MRIVLVSTAYPLRGGPAQFIALLARTLKKRGHTVFILSFRRQYPRLLFPGKTQTDEGEDLLPVTAHPLLNTINPISWLRAFFWMKSKRPHLLIFNYWMPFFLPCYATLAFLTREILHVGSLLVTHNVIPHERRPGDRLITRIGLRTLSYFIVMSESVRSDLIHYKDDAQHLLVPHPIYTYFPPPVSRAEARQRLGLKDSSTILFFGYIRAYKGLAVLMQSVQEIIRKFPIKLLICGEFYEGREETLDMIRRLELATHIDVIDRFIPNEEVGLYFCAADLVVLPYLSATQSGIVKVAYHYDRPVVVTRVGGLPEAVPDGRCGYVVPPADSSALADAILKFFSEEKGPAFEQNVREEKKKYTWDRMADAIESFMEPSVSP